MERRSGGAAERRSGGAAERRNGGAAEGRSGGAGASGAWGWPEGGGPGPVTAGVARPDDVNASTRQLLARVRMDITRTCARTPRRAKRLASTQGYVLPVELVAKAKEEEVARP